LFNRFSGNFVNTSSLPIHRLDTDVSQWAQHTEYKLVMVITRDE